jgi:hypothetical protein
MFEKFEEAMGSWKNMLIKYSLDNFQNASVMMKFKFNKSRNVFIYRTTVSFSRCALCSRMTYKYAAYKGLNL